MKVTVTETKIRAYPKLMTNTKIASSIVLMLGEGYAIYLNPPDLFAQRADTDINNAKWVPLVGKVTLEND